MRDHAADQVGPIGSGMHMSMSISAMPALPRPALLPSMGAMTTITVAPHGLAYQHQQHPSMALLALPDFASTQSPSSTSSRAVVAAATEAAVAAAAVFQPSDVSILLCDTEGDELARALQAAGYSVVQCDGALEAMALLMHVSAPGPPLPHDNTDSRHDASQQRHDHNHDREGLDSESDGHGGRDEDIIHEISRARAHYNPASDFDLVICDAQATAPQGFHLINWLAATSHTAHLPIFLASTDPSIASTERWLRRGAADVLRKPYLPTLILNTLFTFFTARLQQKQLLSVQARGDRFKQQLVQEKLRRRRGSSRQRSGCMSTAATVAPSSSPFLSSSLSSAAMSSSAATATAAATAATSTLPAAPFLMSSASVALPILLNVLLLSTRADHLSHTLIEWLGQEFLINIVPCASTDQVLAHLRQPRAPLPSAMTPHQHHQQQHSQQFDFSGGSTISNRLRGGLGADLLLLDEQMLGESAADAEFAAAVTSRCCDNHHASHHVHHHSVIAPPPREIARPFSSPSSPPPADESDAVAVAATATDATGTCTSASSTMVPLMLLTDSEQSMPSLTLLALLQRSLVGVLELPLSQALVQSKLSVFLRAVEQHRRRFQLSQRALTYSQLLLQLRSSGATGTANPMHMARSRASWSPSCRSGTGSDRADLSLTSPPFLLPPPTVGLHALMSARGSVGISRQASDDVDSDADFPLRVAASTPDELTLHARKLDLVDASAP